MTLLGAMFAAVSGLDSQGRKLGVISDNIANVSTIGYKGAGVLFSSLVTGKGNINSFSPGGTQAKIFSNIDSQGLLQPSQSSTSLALNGNGFFVVKETSAEGSTNSPLFTRSGAFKVDDDGFLVNTSGAYLQGWKLDDSGNVIGGDIASVAPVNLSNQSNPSQKTTEISIDANFPATDIPETGAPGGTTGAIKRDMEVLVYDSVGVAHNVKIVWQRVVPTGSEPAATQSVWKPTIESMKESRTGKDSLTDAAGNVAVPQIITKDAAGNDVIGGNITFDENGKPNIDPTTKLSFEGLSFGSGGVIGKPTPPAETGNGIVTVDLGEKGKTNGLTVNSNDYVPKNITQNGVPFGSFSGVTVSETGLVRAIFTNGRSKAMFQLPIATFNDPSALVELSGNLYREENQSGSVILQQPTVGGAGKIVAGALEGSTVDMAEEFTNMIITQKAYSANTRIITASDSLLDELIRIV